LIRPDGTGKRELGEGEAPAWLPDNSGLIVNRAQALWRVNADGSGAVRLPNTDGGGSPSVSTDGKYLAYSRLVQGNTDIWVLRLDGGNQ
jgi:Tol biopolymer transport system component